MALLDEFQAAQPRGSKNAAAAALGVPRARWGDWQNGTRPVPDAYIVRMARATGRDPGAMLAAAHAEREVNPDTAAVWRALAARAAA